MLSLKGSRRRAARALFIIAGWSLWSFSVGIGVRGNRIQRAMEHDIGIIDRRDVCGNCLSGSDASERRSNSSVTRTTIDRNANQPNTSDVHSGAPDGSIEADVSFQGTQETMKLDIWPQAFWRRRC